MKNIYRFDDIKMENFFMMKDIIDSKNLNI